MKAHDLARLLLEQPNLEVVWSHIELPEWAEEISPNLEIRPYYNYPADGEQPTQENFIVLKPQDDNNVRARDLDQWPEFHTEG